MLYHIILQETETDFFFLITRSGAKNFHYHIQNLEKINKSSWTRMAAAVVYN